MPGSNLRWMQPSLQSGGVQLLLGRGTWSAHFADNHPLLAVHSF